MAKGVESPGFTENGNAVEGIHRVATGEVGNVGSREMVDRQAQIERIRGVRRDDIGTILEWASDPKVRKHLVPAPKVPSDWNDKTQKQQAIDSYAEYLNNNGEPEKIMPAIAIGKNDKPLAIAIVRWRGDPYVPAQERIASLEGLIVDPENQGKLVGTTFVASLIELIFYGYKGYSGSRGAKEIRAWIMNDKEASPWEPNFNFFRRLGFQVVPADKHWKEYVEQRGMKNQLAEEERGRDALWFHLAPEWFEKAKLENPTIIVPCKFLDLNLLKTNTI